MVVTDGSNLYPAVLPELWPDAQHQLCVFHALKELHKQVLDAVRRCVGGCPGGATGAESGGRGTGPRAGARRRGLIAKEQSAFIFKHRWLIVWRRDKMSDRERADLATMLSYLPALKVLRDFVDRLEALFEEGQSEAQAWGRHSALFGQARFSGVPELATALGALSAEKFGKMVAFLMSPAGRRVRTNNHVERVNRRLRYEEKARYRWRSRRTTVRFLALLLDRYWGRERAPRNRWSEGLSPTARDQSSTERVPVVRAAG